MTGFRVQQKKTTARCVNDHPPKTRSEAASAAVLRRRDPRFYPQNDRLGTTHLLHFGHFPVNLLV